jgi:hypothetical protein
MTARKDRTSGSKGESCFWYAFGLEDNEPLPAIFLFDCKEGSGATLIVFDEVGTDTRRSVKHMSIEATTANDRRRNGGWSFERSDLRIKAERMTKIEETAKAKAAAAAKKAAATTSKA